VETLKFDRIEFETKGKEKKVKCLNCKHTFKATFYKKDPAPDDVAYCPKCGETEFKWA
jgi:NAD-dependent SIR2 family protein deacetylase